MKLQIRVDDNGVISDVKFKTFGCGSAIASSSYMTERVKGMSLEQAGAVKNTEIAKELCLPPVKRASGYRTPILALTNPQSIARFLPRTPSSRPSRTTKRSARSVSSLPRNKHRGPPSRLPHQQQQPLPLDDDDRNFGVGVKICAAVRV